ncbi:MAG: hypothetical protein JWR01_2183, partial [Subtercola sp.]|nr:hypothetical protein [Subtercola sp.]
GVEGADRPSFGEYDRTRFVHGSQTLDLHGPLPSAGEVELDCEITGLADKGSGALITWTTTAVLEGSLLFTSAASGFLVGAGGFGADSPEPLAGTRPSAVRHLPEGPPHRVLPMATRAEQALLYRLSGDRNPLHSDPETAVRGGFTRPILHGLCVLGSAARVVLGDSVDSLTHLEARFTAPVLPGDELSVQSWEPDARIHLFRASGPGGARVLDRGVVSVAARE